MKRYIKSNSCGNSYFGDTRFHDYDYDYNAYEDLDDAKSVVDALRSDGYCATINTRSGRNGNPEEYVVIYWKC